MKRRAYITIPISVILLICMVVSSFLMMQKPNTSQVSTAQKLAEYTKPSVARILGYAIVDWQFDRPSSYADYSAWVEVNDYLKTLQYRSIIGGSGSGAVISSNGYIVTNAHVVEIAKLDDQAVANEGLKMLASQVASHFKVTEKGAYAFLQQYAAWKKVTKVVKVILPGGDKYDGEIKSYGAPIGEGKDVAVIKIEAKNLPTLRLGDSDKLEQQDNIWVAGYPAAAESELLSPDSQLVSTMNGGQITAKDKKSTQGSPILQINAAATHGNSGGPVVNSDDQIVGLLTFRGDTVNGQEVQGFNFVVPVNTVKEFIDQAGAKNTESDTDHLYRQGLEFFWGGYYNDALAKFEEVQRLDPNHSEIKRFITESQTKSSQSKILWSKYSTLFYIFDGIAILLIAGLMIFTFVLKPKNRQLGVKQDAVPVADNKADLSKIDEPKKPTDAGMPIIDGLEDLNHDGKIDMQDVLLALQKNMNKDQKDDKNN